MGSMCAMLVVVGKARERHHRTMLRVRDAIDREYAAELHLAALAQLAHVSAAHLIRMFKSVFGETRTGAGWPGRRRGDRRRCQPASSTRSPVSGSRRDAVGSDTRRL